MKTAIIDAIDTELAQLIAARKLIAGVGTPGTPLKRGPGRPKGTTAKPVKVKRIMSAEGRARIAAAQRKRHAAAKRVAKSAK